ncbi:hypothetical protein M8C21_000319, partial [Ambrosia artemisiifolia]
MLWLYLFCFSHILATVILFLNHLYFRYIDFLFVGVVF